MGSGGLAVRWVTAFLDSPTEAHEASVGFWRSVTGYDVSPRRGSSAEFATLVPPRGDPHLRVQRLGSGPPGVHLDLHVDDIGAASAQAARLGAVEVGADDGVRVMRSPGGLPWCLVDGPEQVRAAPAEWSGPGELVHRSVVDQVCVDVPAEGYDAEETFWASLTGWSMQPRAALGLRAFLRPEGMPMRLLMQRLDEPTGPARAHLDLAADDRDAEVARHEALGAAVVRRTPWWTTLRDPTGLEYCVTDRDPETGLLP